MQIKGSVAIVTGGRRGIGRAISECLYDAGAQVAVLAQTAAEESRGVRGDLYIAADLAAPAGRRGLVDSVARSLGPPTILVNCAGAQVFFPAERYPLEQFAADHALLVSAALDLSQQIYPYLRAAGRGKIINIVSIVAFQGARNIVGYVSAKHALLGLTRCLSNEWAPANIQVNAVAPGYIETDMLRPLLDDPLHSAQMLGRIPAGRYGQPEEVAEAVAFLVRADYVSGTTLFVDGGWSAR